MTIPAMIARHAAKLFREAPVITPDAELTDLGLDALDRIVLAMEIEDEFGIKLTDEQIHAWRVVADVCAVAG